MVLGVGVLTVVRIEGQRSGPGSKRRRRAPLRWRPQFRARRHSTAFADTESGSSEPDTTSTHMRRCDRTPSTVSVVVKVILPHAAGPQHPSVPSARRTMKRQTTGARSRGARWEEVVRALMERPGAPTAEDLTGRGPMPARPRRRPGGRLGDGGHHPTATGEEGR